ncbi:MAG: RHS repeat-associated core domain-containing protein, partial [Chloroflexota bacterium]
MTQTLCLGTPTCTPANSTYAYDESNRLTSVNGQAYTWDNNGNLLNDGTNTYAYDAANRLTSVVGGGNTSTYAYNGLGDRVSQTVNGVTTNYTLDLNAGLTQVLADGTSTYLYGAGRIGEKQASGFVYHLPDALGSVRQLTNASAAVTLARSYEPYGSVLTSAASAGVSTAYSFTGEWGDASGLLHLRARYYASSSGRFFQRDSWKGNDAEPTSFNAYLYAQANPIRYVDPLGLWVLDSDFELTAGGGGLYSQGLLVGRKKLCPMGPCQVSSPASSAFVAQIFVPQLLPQTPCPPGQQCLNAPPSYADDIVFSRPDPDSDKLRFLTRTVRDKLQGLASQCVVSIEGEFEVPTNTGEWRVIAKFSGTSYKFTGTFSGTNNKIVQGFAWALDIITLLGSN